MLRSTLRRVASSAAARLQSRQQVHINRVFPTPAGKRFLSTTPAAAATAGSDLGGGGLEVVTPLTVQPGQLDATGTFDTWWPVDPLGHFIEYVAVSGDMTWAGGILAGTAITRLFMFPMAVKMTKNAMILYNVMPETKLHMDRLTRAKESGDQQEQADAVRNVQAVYKKHGANPLYSVGMILVQMPVFMSFFFFIRQACESDPSTELRQSLMRGGLDADWYQALQLPMDISGPDPTFLLPVITSISMGLLFKFGSDPGQQPEFMKSPAFWGGFPLMLFSVSVFQEFPAALFLYWLPSNCAALLQAVILNRVPILSGMVGIPKRIKHDIKAPNPFDNIKKNLEKAQEEANQQNAVKKSSNAHSTSTLGSIKSNAAMTGKERRMARRRNARRRK